MTHLEIRRCLLLQQLRIYRTDAIYDCQKVFSYSIRIYRLVNIPYLFFCKVFNVQCIYCILHCNVQYIKKKWRNAFTKTIINTFLDRLLLNWNFYSVLLLGAEGERCQVVDSMTQLYYGEIRPPCQIGIHLFKLSI